MRREISSLSFAFSLFLKPTIGNFPISNFETVGEFKQSSFEEKKKSFCYFNKIES